jgi:hypothetical protein
MPSNAQIRLVGSHSVAVFDNGFFRLSRSPGRISSMVSAVPCIQLDSPEIAACSEGLSPYLSQSRSTPPHSTSNSAATQHKNGHIFFISEHSAFLPLASYFFPWCWSLQALKFNQFSNNSLFFQCRWAPSIQWWNHILSASRILTNENFYCSQGLFATIAWKRM